MQSRFHPMFYVLIPLAALGIAQSFESLLSAMFIPIAILLVLYVVYLLSPQGRARKPRYRGPSYPSGPSRFRQPDRAKPKQKRSPSPFRVIEGKKDKDDDTPRYH
ncbi:hypothetical protein ACFPVX_07250 [Cohnella faecalis]|uniref:Uncharacterized protein n=1 Tax=Cohnella faecalis TaxID=2315694 RepID=A0A398CLN3_9BACL|nr:hypothetical protein [Cohnella faecalis]RIE00747.1 hypothetical protein D3H35_26500 [Cohnella faecalis]